MSKESKSNNSDEKIVVRSGSLTGKFPGLGNKMQKILRVFRKDNLSQSTQDLMMEEGIQQITQSNQKISEDSDENEEEEEEEEIVKIINEKQINKQKLIKEKRKMMVRSQALSNSDWSSENDFGSKTNLVIEKGEIDEEIQEIKNEGKDKHSESSNSKKSRKLKRSEKIHSNGLESKSMDVIVDIHQENINKSQQDNESIEEIVEILSENNQEENDNKFSSVVRQKSSEKLKKNSFDSGKKQRKRWSTPADTNLISVPRKGSSSSTSEKGNSWFKPVKPIPAPRNNKFINVDNEDQVDDLGLVNHGFESDQDNVEQILTIETEHGSVEKMKIEMKSVRDECEEIQSIEDISDIERLSEHSMNVSNVQDVKASKGEKNNLLKPVMTIDAIDSEVQDSISLIKSSSSTSSRRKKKKQFKKLSKDVVTTDESTSSMVWNEQLNRDDTQVEKDETKLEPREIIKTKKRKEKLKKSLSSSNQGQTTSPSEIASLSRVKSASKSRKVRKNSKYSRQVNYISITIIKADMLEVNFMTRHPMVIVHIVEEKTGNYLKISNKSESKNTYLQPLITGTFEYEERQTMVPYWEEELIFEYDFEAILNNSESDRTLILFEIVDLPSFADASDNYDHLGGGSCWYKIAWAFLKPVNENGVSHIDKSLRLQLYKPKSSKKSIRQKCEPYIWWQSGYRDKYPSTLYVKVTSVNQPQLEPVFYGQLSLNDLSDNRSKSNQDFSLSSSDVKKHTQWSRLPSQSCKIPNKIYFNTELSENGCFFVAFSNNGKYLACANCEEYDYPITVYKIDEEKVFFKFSGHKTFIYSLDWSNNDHYLLSVSSDQTAKIWDVKNKINYEISMLPHPSYVYCGKFDPKNYRNIITGCYDHVSRIWTRKKDHQNYELIQELEGHKGFVNCICFSKENDIFTADSLGVIIQWTLKKIKGGSFKEWQIIRKIKLKEASNVVINTILHPNDSHLILHTRDNQLKMIDLTTGAVVQKYSGLKNSRIQITAKISPCGSLLLCGGEDAALNVWNVETGKCIAVYQQNIIDVAVTCVDYHPNDHVLAFCIFGCSIDVKILRYSQYSYGESVGLKLLDSTGSKRIPSGKIRSPSSSSPSYSDLKRKGSNKSARLKDQDENMNNTLNDSREDLRLRLKMFNDHENMLKTKSTNKFSSIIAKIDRILSNSPSVPRSSHDIEANRLEDSLDSMRSPPRRSLKNSSDVSSTSPTLKDKLTPSSEPETIEMKSLRKNRPKVRKKSKNKRNSSSSRSQLDDITRISPDNSINQKKSKKKLAKSTRHNHNHVQEIKKNDKSLQESSEGSNGTYTVDKTYKSDRKDDSRGESGSSARSDVTFIIEREIPIAKPRKKNNKSIDNSINNKSNVYDLT